MKICWIIVLTSAVFLTFTGLSIPKPPGEKVPIDIYAVNSIEMLKAYRPPDTTQCVWKRVSKEQAKSFVDKWNSPANKELKKYPTIYRIAIYFKNKSIREFRANGQFINDNNGWCVDFKDKGYFDKLYSEAIVRDEH
ncbi:MAG: hypothetical protein JNL63_10750 [Bacteroidia bacterium]|nr:hypothetical protein [Bacteroidia bacterium]